MSEIRIFHNVSQDTQGRPIAVMDGYKDDDPVVEVFRYEVESIVLPSTDGSVAENAFFLFNVGDQPSMNRNGTPDSTAVEYRNRKLRSLSVGDLVCIDGRFHAVDSFGFRAVSAPNNLVTATPAGIVGTVALPA